MSQTYNKNLWGGRFNRQPHPFFKKFNDSINIDYRLAKYDIIGSIAWSKALLQCKVLNQNEQLKIENALKILLNTVQSNPTIMLNSNCEDVHSWVESKLIEMVGNLGKKLHTGRSRNDQITTDLKLWCKSTIENLSIYLKKIQYVLIIQSQITFQDIIPGYTHLQKAQPITFAYWCLAYFEMFKRDEDRLKNTLNRLNVSPLGSGALSGTFCSIDREQLAYNMGFKKSTDNCLDAVSDRDYVIELLSVASISMMHLSRLSEDLIFFNSNDVNLIELSDLITSGSSLMPQKKNPDALELIRGRTGRVYGYLVSMLTILKGLPLSYNKDMQEDKEILFSSMDIWLDCLKMASLVLRYTKVNRFIGLNSSKHGYLNATELTDYLVKKGVTFREAHYISGQIVLEAINRTLTLEELDISIFKKYHMLFEKDVYYFLNLSSCINTKNSKGGVSFKQVLISIKKIKKNLY